MASTQLSIETKADGSGVTISGRTFHKADTLTVYAIGRDDDDVFVENLAADAWALVSKTGGIASGDLVAAGDMKSAVFTAALDGSCKINVTDTLSLVINTQTETLWVLAKAIVSLAQLKTYMGESKSTHDQMLVDLIETMSCEIESDCNQFIARQQATDVLDGNGTSELAVRSGRIISLVGDDEDERLASFQYRTSATAAWTDIVDNEALIHFDTSTWTIRLLEGFTFLLGEANIRIIFNGGFDPIPTELQKMCLERIQVTWKESNQGGDFLAKVSKNLNEGGTSTNVSLKDISERWEKIIYRYKRHAYEYRT